MTEADRALWLNLCAVVLNDKVTDVSRIHRAAKRLKGRRNAAPSGYHYVGSPFHRLFADGLTVLGGSERQRASLQVHAQAVKAVLENGSSEPATILGIEATAYFVDEAQGLEDAMRRPFRADIDG